MIFIILSTALVGGIVVWLVNTIRSIRRKRRGYYGSEYDHPALNFLWMLLTGAGAFVVGVIMPIGFVATYNPTYAVTVSATELRALNSGDSVSGHFFLGSGVVDGKRVLNYITEQNGYALLQQADASWSRIYEDEATSPHVDTVRFYADQWWIAPFAVAGMRPYTDFHIPPASILENYTIDNG